MPQLLGRPSGLARQLEEAIVELRASKRVMAGKRAVVGKKVASRLVVARLVTVVP